MKIDKCSQLYLFYREPLLKQLISIQLPLVENLHTAPGHDQNILADTFVASFADSCPVQLLRYGHPELLDICWA